MKKNALPAMSPAHKEISEKMMNLALDRIFKRAYQGLAAGDKLNWDKTFSSDSDSQKSQLVKQYLPDFESQYTQELNSIIKEMREKI